MDLQRRGASVELYDNGVRRSWRGGGGWGRAAGGVWGDRIAVWLWWGCFNRSFRSCHVEDGLWKTACWQLGDRGGGERRGEGAVRGFDEWGKWAASWQLDSETGDISRDQVLSIIYLLPFRLTRLHNFLFLHHRFSFEGFEGNFSLNLLNGGGVCVGQRFNFSN